ncbi:hypothetical protein I5Q96_10110 [Serratia marcescens]|uniref:hypothetical protein n=1 Tax=Serratia TaxID=613 RepID=UPI0018D96255|nr:hypothetical protein [Serratia marcescens]MBH3025795.1 hypothetical protein [Serratia marcescens]MBH3041358.1 hypothetical protein [Serratia marcescens]MBH3294412.1 hypothetical protein [Serratia marcescens]HAV6637606.1 hypothetical protein [Serratia marcescens]
MSNNTGIHVFTDESLALHDYELALKVNQATATHVARTIVSMNAPQQLRSLSAVGRNELMFDDETLLKIISTVKK